MLHRAFRAWVASTLENTILDDSEVHSMPPELYTQRLILRPLALADAPRTQELFGKWEIVRFLNAAVPWPFPGDGALRYYREVALPAVERGDEWNWTIRLKDDPSEHIGAINLSRGDLDNRGFWLGLPWQGRGYMSEAVAAVNDFWFDVLGFEVLRAPKALENIASNRISEKTGMRVVAAIEKDYVCGRLRSQVWEITADEWHANRGRVLAPLKRSSPSR